jgi:Zn-dependent protease with chaperone function
MPDAVLVSAALQHFPPGFRLAFALWAVPVVGAGTFLLTHLAGRELLSPLRAAVRAHGAALHWTERNRLGWNARRWSGLLAVAAALSVGLHAFVFTGPLGLAAPAWRGVFLATWALFCGLVGALQVSAEALPVAVPLRTRAASLAGVLGLRLAGLGACLLAGLVWVPSRPWTALLALGLATASVAWLARGGTVRLLRAVGLVHSASPRLVDAVRRAAVETRSALPEIAVLRGWAPNAFAVSEAQLLLFTEGAQDGLSPEQLEAVASHELEHLAEDASLVWMRRLPLVLVLPLSLWRGLFLVERVEILLGGLALYCVLVVVLKTVLTRRLRRAERDADSASHHHGATYARALEATYRQGGVPAVLSARSVHPSLFDRMRAAGVEPD